MPRALQTHSHRKLHKLNAVNRARVRHLCQTLGLFNVFCIRLLRAQFGEYGDPAGCLNNRSGESRYTRTCLLYAFVSFG